MEIQHNVVTNLQVAVVHEGNNWPVNDLAHLRVYMVSLIEVQSVVVYYEVMEDLNCQVDDEHVDNDLLFKIADLVRVTDTVIEAENVKLN